MRTSFLLPLFLVFLLILSGCVTPDDGTVDGENPPLNGDDSPWYGFSPVQAETNPWQVMGDYFSHSENENGRVSEWLAQNNITVREFGFVPGAEITCAALNCPRGDVLVVYPGNEAAKTFLKENGFTPYTKPGAYIQENDTAYEVIFFNPTNQSLYFGGCNAFTPFQRMGSEYTPVTINTCIWEGIPTVNYPLGYEVLPWQPSENGEYYVSIAYGKNCTPDQPLNESSCETIETIRTLNETITNVKGTASVILEYAPVQCNTNPWQNDETTLESDVNAFETWLTAQGIYAEDIQFTLGNTSTLVCLACNCTTGNTYTITAPASQSFAAQKLGFVWKGIRYETNEPPVLENYQWFVGTPYQCYSNLWNVKKEPARSAQKDIENMVLWMEEKGVDVDHTTFIRGVSLSQECLKVSTDKYGVGVDDQASMDLLPSLGFVAAGKGQVELFTNTTDESPLTLVYKSKFCSLPPWDAPEFVVGNEEAIVHASAAWL
ncbi:MAG: hypothetical protein AABY11_00645, partial [archaeon]